MKQQSGVGLIEVLVSLLVVAIGILGMIGLQTLSLKQNAEARTFGFANQLAADMNERIRANQLYAINNSGYNLALGNTSISAGDCSAACSDSDLAAYDLVEWLTQLERLIPQSQAAIEVTPIAGLTRAAATIKINIQYRHDYNASTTLNGDYEQFVFNSQI